MLFFRWADLWRPGGPDHGRRGTALQLQQPELFDRAAVGLVGDKVDFGDLLPPAFCLAAITYCFVECR